MADSLRGDELLLLVVLPPELLEDSLAFLEEFVLFWLLKTTTVSLRDMLVKDALLLLLLLFEVALSSAPSALELFVGLKVSETVSLVSDLALTVNVSLVTELFESEPLFPVLREEFLFRASFVVVRLVKEVSLLVDIVVVMMELLELLLELLLVLFEILGRRLYTVILRSSD